MLYQLSYAHREGASNCRRAQYSQHGGSTTIGPMPSVLIVEDDPVLSEVMRRHLTAAGFEVASVNDGSRALKKLRFERPDVVVLDLMIPGADGWSVIDQVRAEGDVTPIAFEDVPKEMVDRAKKELPDVTFDSARKRSNGNIEVRGKNKQGKVREVEFNPAGEVVEIE